MDNARIREYNLEKAHITAAENLNKIFPNMVKNLAYQHHDAGGYWYTFQLVNDSRVQTYCVRPSDIM